MMRTPVRLIVPIALLLVLLAACRGTPAEAPAPELPTAEPSDTPAPTATDTPEPSATPAPPEVVIEAPPSNSTVAVGEDVLLQVRARDAAGVSRVELFVDSALVRTDFTPEDVPLKEFSLLQRWVPEEEGDYTLRVIAYRGDGAASSPASILVSVEPAAEGPAAGPAGGAGGGTCITVAATSLNVRTGPGAVYDRVGVLAMGEEVNVTGKFQDGSWWYVDYGGGKAWVAASHSYHSGDCAAVPVVVAPPPPTHAGGTPTPSITPGGPTLTPSATWTPSVTPGGPTLTPSPTYTPTPSITPGGPTLTPSATWTSTPTPSATAPTADTATPTATATFTNGEGPTSTHTPTPTYTPTTPPQAQVAPPDANFNSPLNIALDSTASVTDFVSYPGGDTTDRVRWDITGMNQNPSLSGGRARLILAVSCFGTGTQNVQFFTGGQTYSCGQTIVDREVTYDSRTGQVTITAVAGANTYIQWVLTGTATRVN